MASPQDPSDSRPFVGMEDAPVRCHMESSFLSILHSAGLEEWAAQQSELATWQTEQVHERSESRSSGGKSGRRAPSSRAIQKSSSSRHSGRSSRKTKDQSDRSSRSSRSKHSDDMTKEEEEEEMRRRAESFVPDYSGYNTMDAELNIIRQQLMMHEHE